MDGTAFGTMGECVVYQSRYQHIDALRIGCDFDIIRDVRDQLNALFVGFCFKRQYAGKDGTAYIYLRAHGFYVLDFGEVEKLYHDVVHFIIFILNVCEPFVVSDFPGEKLGVSADG